MPHESLQMYNYLFVLLPDWEFEECLKCVKERVSPLR